jgi:hypothetical protein
VAVTGGAVGGDPAQISASGAALISAARSVGQTSAGLDRAGSTGSGAAAGAPVSAAISRFAAASSQLSADLETQLQVAGLLAKSGGADLATATGTELPRGRRPS